MHKVRLIPRLDIKGPNLIKGIHLEGLRIIGDPQEYATRYYEDGADEIMYLDTVASLYGRNNLTEIVQRTSSNISIPLCVAGGIRSIDDIQKLLRAGADKVAINSAAIENPELIRKAAEYFGSQCIVISIEYKIWPDNLFIKSRNSTVSRGASQKYIKDEKYFQVYTENGRQQTGMEAFEWACEAVKMGAGEILLTSIDKEGVQKGFELELTNAISKEVSVPVIAAGGAGSKEDIRDIILKSEVDAVSIASVLHYNKNTISEIKSHLKESNIKVADHDYNLTL